jgi:hypothetical protein
MNNNYMSDTVAGKNLNNKQETSTVVNSTVSNEKNPITLLSKCIDILRPADWPAVRGSDLHTSPEPA